MLSGIIENCWAIDGPWAKWHVNPANNNTVGIGKGITEGWVALLGGQYFASTSTQKAAEIFFRVDGTVKYHNSFVWNMFPGRDPAGPGWYEFNGVADTVESIPFGEPGFLVSHATGVGRGTLQGQNAHFTMAFASWGRSTPILCADFMEGGWNGTMALEINNAP